MDGIAADQIRQHTLRDGDMSVTVLSLGCILQDWQVPLNGTWVPTVLGFRDPAAYLHNPNYLGAIVGRVANRISGASFGLAGQTFVLDANEPPHHLHGGPRGLHARNWTMEPDGARAVRFSLVSGHDDGGYPGEVSFAVTLSLRGSTLNYDMTATSDRPTPISLAQHAYYSLGVPDVRQLELRTPSSRWTPTDDRLIPTGDICPLEGRPFDFRAPQRIGNGDPEGHGLDLNYVLDPGPTILRGNGLRLVLETDQPCLQLYTGHGIRPGAQPLPGQSHRPFAGVCLEPQHYPDAVNRPEFPLSLVTPEQPYRQRLAISIMPDHEAATDAAPGLPPNAPNASSLT